MEQRNHRDDARKREQQGVAVVCVKQGLDCENAVRAGPIVDNYRFPPTLREPLREQTSGEVDGASRGAGGDKAYGAFGPRSRRCGSVQMDRRDGQRDRSRDGAQSDASALVEC